MRTPASNRGRGDGAPAPPALGSRRSRPPDHDGSAAAVGQHGRMTADHRRLRRAGTALAGLLLGLLTVLAAPAAPASAHATLQVSDPAADAIVPEAPTQITLTFTESVQVVQGKIQVLAPDGSPAAGGEPVVSGAAVTIPMRVQAPGTYLVSYRVISADSHPVAGGFTYSVGAPSTPPSLTDEGADVDPAVRAAIPVAKFVGYVGLLLLVGPIMVLALLWPHRLSRRAPARVVWTGFGLVGASTLGALALQAPYSTGSTLLDVTVSDLGDVLGTSFGAVMLVRLGVLSAAAVLVRPLLAAERGDSRIEMALLTVLGVAGAATWPLTGHPAASPVAGVSVVIDAVHLAAMAVWLGGLVMLVGFLLPSANDEELGAILPIWSRWATVAVGALVLAGTTQALIEVGSLTALINTAYGQLIIVKVSLVVTVIAVAAYARALVRRRHADSGTRTLRRAVWVELGVTVVVLGLTAALVQLPPGRTAAATAAAGKTTPGTMTLTNEAVSLQVSVVPARVGINSIHLYAYGPDQQPLPIVEWVATAALPARNVEPIEIPLLRITDNHTIGDIALPTAGDWQLSFTLRTSEIDQTVVKGSVTIR